MDEQISAAITQLEEDQKRAIEAARKLSDGVAMKGKGTDLNEYRLVEGGPKKGCVDEHTLKLEVKIKELQRTVEKGRS